LISQLVSSRYDAKNVDGSLKLLASRMYLEVSDPCFAWRLDM